MQIGGIQKTSLLDYPEKISAIVFTKGCNFRCGYCHNPELFSPSSTQAINSSEFFEFLNKRRGKLDAVVITGGEPCLQKDLLEFILKIKEFGFLVKLDTNGSFPDILRKIIPHIDYVAMDIKAPLEKYSQIIGVNVDIRNIKESIDLIMTSGLDYEFRTTVVKSQLSEEDFLNISETIKGAKKYYLQKFRAEKVLDNNFQKETTYTEEEFAEIMANIKGNLKKVELRG